MGKRKMTTISDEQLFKRILEDANKRSSIEQRIILPAEIIVQILREYYKIKEHDLHHDQ